MAMMINTKIKTYEENIKTKNYIHNKLKSESDSNSDNDSDSDSNSGTDNNQESI